MSVSANAITDREVHAALAGGAAGTAEVFRHCDAQVRCGRCVATMRSMIGDHSCAGERRHVTDAEPVGTGKGTHKRCRDCSR